MAYSMPTGLGMDINQLVSQLMSTEQGPINKVKSTIKTIDTQVSDLGRLKSALSDLKTAMSKMTASDFLNTNKVTSSDPATVSVKSDGTTPNGFFQLNVTQLATPQTVTYQLSGVMDPKTAVSGLQGTVTINGQSVDLGTSDLSLTDFVSKVNGAGVGVTASLASQGGGSYKVVLMGQKTGEVDGKITTDGQNPPLGDPLAGLLAGTGNTPAAIGGSAAQSTQYTLNGVSLTSQSNTISDVVPGLTLSFNKLGSSGVSVERDIDAIQKKAQDFVDAYNKVVDLTTSLRGKDGSFKGDSMLLSVQRQLYEQINAPYNALGSATQMDSAPLVKIGITLDSGGKLKLDGSTFSKALQSDPDAVAKMLKDGPGTKLVNGITDLLDSKGLIGTRDENLQTNRRQQSNRQDSLQEALDKRAIALKTQYSKLDASLASMQASLNRVASSLGM
ncbi:flagellar filament capping protein FliD [Pseudogulbenkiania subflava]|uniref:Flagellar hook-associated protein 2 n=1 Tax=Pseudogulbenkiania subflava DSM 22618 TaxID=1123014 RepID=A0A1Y6C273_9NEIS|nr:flagellar filament capping protein FliD [Pseudogulbenkiania subflava]SMF40182.1 flagellar hook-associated protein 2 [Pseudogulbenkiania subflava DSM 22618]